MCVQRIVVMLTVNLPVSLQELTENFQFIFTNVIAIVAGVKVSDVRIVNVKSTPIRRRLLSESILIEVEVLAQDSASASQIARQLDAESIHRQMQKMGLPQITIIKSATVPMPTSGEIPTAPGSFDPESSDPKIFRDACLKSSYEENFLELWHVVLICVVCCFSVALIILARRLIKRCHRRAKKRNWFLHR